MIEKTISKNTYYQTIGLLKLAEKYRNNIQDIERTLADTLDIKNDGYNYYGHVSDAVFGEDDFNAEILLDKLNIGLEE